MKTKYKNIVSFSQMLRLSALLLFISFVALMVFNYFTIYKTLTERDLERKKAVVALASDLVYQRLHAIEQIGLSLASNSRLISEIDKNDWASAISLYASIPEMFPWINRIFLASPDGIIMADIPHLEAAVGTSRVETDWFKGVSKHWHPYVCEVFKRDSLPRKNVVDVAIPVRKSPDVVSGILVLQFELGALATWFKDVPLDHEEFIFIVDQHGNIAYHPFFPPQGDIVNFSSVPVIQEVLQGLSGSGYVFNPIERVKRFSVYKPVDRFGWGVVLAQPASLAFSDRDQVSRIVIFVYAGFMFLGLVLLLVTRRLMTQQSRSSEKALRTSEARLRQMVEHCPFAIASTDNRDHVLFLNAKFIQMFGYDQRDLSCVEDWWPLAYPDPVYRQEIFDRWQLAEIKAKTRKMEIEPVIGRVTCKDGSVRSVEVTGVNVDDYNLIFFVDVTQRLKALEELNRASETWQRTFDSITDFVFLMDMNCHILQVNRSFAEKLNREPKSFIGQKCHDVVHRQDHYWMTCPMKDLRMDGKPSTREVSGFDGTPLLVTVAPILDDDKNVVGAVHIAKDITELKQATADLKATYEQLIMAQSRLIQSEKMASLGVLAAGVAHEINNPTAFILTNLFVLKDYATSLRDFVASTDDLCDTPKKKEWLQELRSRLKIDLITEDFQTLIGETIEGAERIKKIVRDLKNFAHPDTGCFEMGDLNHCLESSLNIVWNEIRNKAVLVKECGPIPPVSFNPQQISQVFVNLLVNAAQSIDCEGKITLKTSHEGKWVLIEISDTGCGMSEETCSKIFDPFYTTKPVGQGTGLGLAIVQRVIKDHRGEIEVISKPARGTTFLIKLPV